MGCGVVLWLLLGCYERANWNVLESGIRVRVFASLSVVLPVDVHSAPAVLA